MREGFGKDALRIHRCSHRSRLPEFSDGKDPNISQMGLSLLRDARIFKIPRASGSTWRRLAGVVPLELDLEIRLDGALSSQSVYEQPSGVLQHTEKCARRQSPGTGLEAGARTKSCGHHSPSKGGMFHPRHHWKRSKGVHGTSHQSVLTNDSVRTMSVGALTASKCNQPFTCRDIVRSCLQSWAANCHISVFVVDLH